MSDCMTFPNNWRKFLRDYSFKDSDKVYTNGVELIPVFRVEQLIEHLLAKHKPRVLSKRYMQEWNKKEIDKRSPVVLECRETGYMRWLIETLYREEIDAIGEGDMRFWSSYPTPAQRKEVPWDD